MYDILIKGGHVIDPKNGIDEMRDVGISGSSTHRQVKLLRRYVVDFSPDLVVLVMFLNDATEIGTGAFISSAKLLATERQYSFFLNALVGSIEGPILHRQMVRYDRDAFSEGAAGWEEIKGNLADGQALSETHGFRFAVVLYPVLFRLDEDYPFLEVHRTIERFCASVGIPFLDLLGAFAGKKDSSLWVHRTDQHPNEEAHGIAAARLSEFVASEGLLAFPASQP